MKYNLIALACAVLLAAGLSLTVVAGPTEPDTDSDGIVDIYDNCSVVSNANQADEDQDGYGQLCDSDFDDNGKVNAIDFVTFKAEYGAPTPAGEVDYDCNGKVNAIDFITFKAMFGGVPGASGQSCAGSAGSCTGNSPCP
jgi:hypothetical protein